MLRKDLKHGDVFQFVGLEGLDWKTVKDGNLPLDNPRNLPISSTAISTRLFDPVILEPAKPLSIVDPPHYRSLTPEPIDVIEAWNLDRYLSNVVKYISRAGEKPGAAEIDDLKKARRWLTRKINKLEGRSSWEYKD